VQQLQSTELDDLGTLLINLPTKMFRNRIGEIRREDHLKFKHSVETYMKHSKSMVQ